MKKIEKFIDAVRANPVRYAACIFMMVVLLAVAFTLGDGLGHQLYRFTH